MALRQRLAVRAENLRKVRVAGRHTAKRLDHRCVSRSALEQIATTLDGLAVAAGLNRTKGWQPVRAAVTGSNVSPPLPESLALLGRDRTVARLRAAAR